MFRNSPLAGRPGDRIALTAGTFRNNIRWSPGDESPMTCAVWVIVSMNGEILLWIVETAGGCPSLGRFHFFWGASKIPGCVDESLTMFLN